jgi:hypothetical protein
VVAALEPLRDVVGERIVGLQQHLAGLEVDHVGDQLRVLELSRRRR